MTRNLFFLMLMVLLAGGAGWLAENPGQMQLEWFGRRIETSAAFLLIALLLLTFALWASFRVLAALLTAPRKWGKARQTLQQERGLQALTEAFIALSDQDMQNAEKAVKAAQNYLPDAALPRLLQLQLSRQQGDDAAVHQQFLALQDAPETRPLALRGLIEKARRDHRMEEAIHLAESLLALRPRHKATVLLLAELYSQQRRWQEGLQLLSQAQKRLVLRGAELAQAMAAIYTEQAVFMLADSNRISALEMLRAALKKQPAFVPAALLYATHAAATEKPASLARIIKKVWMTTPHPLLAERYWLLYADLTPEKRLKKMEELAAITPLAAESLLAIGRAAIEAARWARARETLLAAYTTQRSRAACTLLAELEEKESQDSAKAAYWRDQALTALPPPQWQCRDCGHTPKDWAAHCPECLHFDSIEWKMPQFAVYSAG